MQKIPTLFIRKFAGSKLISMTKEVTPGCEWVLRGEGTPTIKYDGCCVMCNNGVLYRRLNLKRGRSIPSTAIPCQPAPDLDTGEWPHWVPIVEDTKDTHWVYEAFKTANESGFTFTNTTYELIGEHFNGNPYHLTGDKFVQHGATIITDLTDRTYEAIEEYLKTHMCEGIVFHRGNGEMCKIKRRDFGLLWNDK